MTQSPSPDSVEQSLHRLALLELDCSLKEKASKNRFLTRVRVLGASCEWDITLGSDGNTGLDGGEEIERFRGLMANFIALESAHAATLTAYDPKLQGIITAVATSEACCSLLQPYPPEGREPEPCDPIAAYELRALIHDCNRELDDDAMTKLVTAFGEGGKWPVRRLSDSEMIGE
jgi:hypothetical protein